MPTNNPEHPTLTPSDTNKDIQEELLSAAHGRHGVFFVSAVAIQNALKDAKNGASQKATEALDFAGRLPYTQVKPEHLIQVARHAASSGNIKDALFAVRRSISLEEHQNGSDTHLDEETKLYNRTHYLLKDIQTRALIYVTYLKHKKLSGLSTTTQDEIEFHEELAEQINKLEDEDKSGPILAIYELSGKGFGEIHALSQHVLELLKSIGDNTLVNRVQKTIYDRLPSIKPPKNNK